MLDKIAHFDNSKEQRLVRLLLQYGTPIQFRQAYPVE
jgi:hypothetical protein